METSPRNVAVVAPGTNTSTSETTGIVAPQPIPAQPFRFLDLPHDIRLIVYENLLTRRRQTITHNHYSTVTTTTLVTPHPIPPLNLACKLLHEEAGPFIKTRLERMSAPWAAPRLVIHATQPFAKILYRAFMVCEIIKQIDFAKGQISYDISDARASGWAPGFGVTERIINDVGPFAAEAGNFIRQSGISKVDWETKAWRIYKDDSLHLRTLLRDPEDSSDNHINILAELKAKTREVAQSARAGLLHIAVRFDTPNDGAYNMHEFLSMLATKLADDRIKAAAHTFGWHSYDTEVDGFGYMRFDGEMSVETWNEEWA